MDPVENVWTEPDDRFGRGAAAIVVKPILPPPPIPPPPPPPPSKLCPNALTPASARVNGAATSRDIVDTDMGVSVFIAPWVFEVKPLIDD